MPAVAKYFSAMKRLAALSVSDGFAGGRSGRVNSERVLMPLSGSTEVSDDGLILELPDEPIAIAYPRITAIEGVTAAATA